MSAIRVTIADAKGSTPRAAGTSMLVYADRIEGTIGGGALEWQAMASARAMLERGETRAERSVPLGPGLGQCCGGAVTLTFEAAEAVQGSEGAPLWIWGAGHVGRALVSVLAPLDQVSITWIDTLDTRFPGNIPAETQKVVAADPTRLMPHAPRHAQHLIVTYSHDMDLALCHAALRQDFQQCGLIGSETKWARFRTRLRDLGHSDDQIDRITCPIGDPSLGKEPQAIAIGVASRLLSRGG